MDILDILGYFKISPDILRYPRISKDIRGYPKISEDIPGYPGTSSAITIGNFFNFYIFLNVFYK